MWCGGGQGCWEHQNAHVVVGEMKKPRFCVLALGVMSRVGFGRQSGALMPVDNFRSRGGGYYKQDTLPNQGRGWEFFFCKFSNPGFSLIICN